MNSSQFIAPADDNLDETQMMALVCNRVQSIVGKGQKAGYQHFVIFPQYSIKFVSGAKDISNRVENMWGK